jgi:hypothetical protein
LTAIIFELLSSLQVFYFSTFNIELFPLALDRLIFGDESSVSSVDLELLT